MSSAAAFAAHRVLSTQLLPAIRSVVEELGGDEPGSLVHLSPTAIGSRYPSNSAAAIVRHLCGVFDSWGAAGLGGEVIERDRDAEFAYVGPVEPELRRLAELVNRVPEWCSVAQRRGGPGEPTGTAFDLASLRAEGGFTVEWVLAHLIHDVAGHLGHLEVTRDVLLAFGGGQ